MVSRRRFRGKRRRVRRRVRVYRRKVRVGRRRRRVGKRARAVISLPGKQIMPLSLWTNLCWTHSFAGQLPPNTVILESMRCNSVYDPDSSLGPGQVSATPHNLWAQIWSNYFVPRSRLTVHVTRSVVTDNTGLNPVWGHPVRLLFALWVDSDAANTQSYDQLRKRPFVKWYTYDNTLGVSRTMHIGYSRKRQLRSRIDFSTDYAACNTNPNYHPCYMFRVFMLDVTAATPPNFLTFAWDATIWYRTLYTNVKDYNIEGGEVVNDDGPPIDEDTSIAPPTFGEGEEDVLEEGQIDPKDLPETAIAVEVPPPTS